MILATQPTYLVSQSIRTRKIGNHAHIAGKDGKPVCGAQPMPGDQHVPSDKYLYVCRKCHEAVIQWLEDDPGAVSQ